MIEKSIGLHAKYPSSFPIIMKLEFSRKLLEKYSNTRFLENPSSGTRVVSCGLTGGRTDRHDEDNSRFSQFCERYFSF